ncbi:MAG TPA: helix-turn-helix domain-containing protein [Caulobacteraceae bacterium]|nr:helix-turn-helix domain-containing protein [Caulobacteraceae bacterium]
MTAASAKGRPRTRRTEPAEVRRRQLLDAAKRCFRAVGFHATTMAEVAAEAGVSVGLIYQHFASKEALIEGIVLEDLEQQMRDMAVVLDHRPKTLIEAIALATKANLRIMLDRDRTALMIEIAAEATRNPKIRAFVAETEARIGPDYHERLMALKPADWSDEKMAARFEVLGGMLRGLALQAAMNGGRRPNRAALQALNEAAIWLFTPEA